MIDNLQRLVNLDGVDSYQLPVEITVRAPTHDPVRLLMRTTVY